MKSFMVFSDHDDEHSASITRGFIRHLSQHTQAVMSRELHM